VTRPVVLLAMLLFAGTPQAATLCHFATSGSIAFGLYDVLASTPNDTLVNVTVACERNGGPANVVLTVRLSQGSNGTSVTARRMGLIGGGDYLEYGLYRDVSRSSVWGFSDGIDTVSRSITVPNKGSASASFTIYGRIPAQQNVSVGTYSDSILLTVSP